ncbi:MAG: alkaline phosphatase family protein [Mycobacterium sp.]
MTTVKQICLGVAVAGVVAGAGTALSTGTAFADPTSSDSGSSATAGESKPSKSAEARKSSRSGGASTSTDTDTDTATGPRLKRPPRDTAESVDDTTTAEGSTRKPARTTGSPTARKARTTESPAAETNDDPAPSTEPTAAVTPAVETAPPAAPIPVAEPVAAIAVEPVASELEPAATTTTLRPVRTPKAPVTPRPAIPLFPTTAANVGTTAGTAGRNRVITTADVAAQITDPTTQHVLVIGVDGTNLSRVLDDPANAKFFELMNRGTTGASSIVGHTTISNPSWTAILTGVWDSKSGVINNIFTSSTYNSWPTVFDQLEGANRDIRTKAIADWQVIADIAGAGAYGADEIVYIPRGANDPLYIQADAAVTLETVKSILGADAGYEDVPNFLFTYLTQVDEAGHLYGGASQQYAQAISRTNTNIGLILDAVAAREAESCAAGACEDWTVIMVTDHGHQPQQGFGHGFQSPNETSTFVIVDGPGFASGQMNLKYSIVDITPTVVSLFGIAPRSDADGVPLMDRGDSQVDPADLHQALQDAIGMYGWPDVGTNVALSLRTIFASIPYYIDTFTTDITAQLRSIAGQGIFLVSGVAAIAVFPVQFIGDALYAVTNAIAQVVGRLTGAGVIPPSSSSQLRDGQSYPNVLAFEPYSLSA